MIKFRQLVDMMDWDTPVCIEYKFQHYKYETIEELQADSYFMMKFGTSLSPVCGSAEPFIIAWYSN